MSSRTRRSPNANTRSKIFCSIFLHHHLPHFAAAWLLFLLRLPVRHFVRLYQTKLLVLVSYQINGFAMVESNVMGFPIISAIFSGKIRPILFGMSSPKTMEKNVNITSTNTTEIESDYCCSGSKLKRITFTSSVILSPL